jgi:hypothetical protein
MDTMSSHPVVRELERAITGPGDGLAIARDLLLAGAAFGAFQSCAQRLTCGLHHDLPLLVAHDILPSVCGWTL